MSFPVNNIDDGVEHRRDQTGNPANPPVQRRYYLYGVSFRHYRDQGVQSGGGKNGFPDKISLTFLGFDITVGRYYGILRQ